MVDVRQDTAGGRSGPSRWWALAILVPAIPLVVMRQIVDPGTLTPISLAGTPERWVVAVADSGESLGDLRTAIALDLGFAVTLAVVGWLLTRTGLRWWAPERRRRFGWWRAAPAVIVAACALDVAETVLQLAILDAADPPPAVTLAVASLTWWKWIGFLVGAVGVVGLVIGPAVAPVIRPLLRRTFRAVDRTLGEPQPSETPPGAGDRGEAIGICASGGGIRSAAVVIGALRGLTTDGTFGRARWLHAVSGGGFAAAGWRVSSHARDEVELFADGHPWFETVRRRRRYLDNGFGSLLGGVAGAVVRSIFVFGGVLAATVLGGWLLGSLISTWAVHDGFDNLSPSDPTTWSQLTGWRLLLPGLIPIAAGTIMAVAARGQADERVRRSVDRVAIAVIGVGVVLVFLLVAAPIWIRYGRPLLGGLVGRTAEVNAGVLGVLSALGVITAVRKLLTSELKRRWSRLGGFALLAGLALLAGKVADDRANGAGIFDGWWVPVAALAWLVALDIPPSHRLTLNGVYRKRLATTFCLGPGDTTPLAPVDYCDEPAWSSYRGAPGPELVMCGTSHSTRRQAGGLRSHGFTFQAEGVTLHDRESARWADYPSGSWWDGYPRGWIVSRSMALCGAAFASAMGRQSFGSTNALLAAVNLRLGMWVPNPRFPDWFCDRDCSPRVHLGYFVKELFNRYHPDRDPFVYVADGGHRENLGLVEQLRERPRLSIVIDASGDRPGSFSTLKQAIELAGIELGAEVDVDFTQIEQRPDDEPLDCVTTGLVTYDDGTTTELVYAKAQISDRAPVDLRQFAAAHPPFPDYSTGDQFLREEEFDALVELGEHLAARIAAAIATLPGGEGE